MFVQPTIICLNNAVRLDTNNWSVMWRQNDESMTKAEEKMYEIKYVELML